MQENPPTNRIQRILLGNQTMGPKRKGSQLLHVAEKEKERFTEQGYISKTQQGLLERNRSRTERKHKQGKRWPVSLSAATEGREVTWSGQFKS